MTELKKTLNDIWEPWRKMVDDYANWYEQERLRKEAMLDYYLNCPAFDVETYEKLVEIAYRRDLIKGGKRT